MSTYIIRDCVVIKYHYFKSLHQTDLSQLRLGIYGKTYNIKSTISTRSGIISNLTITEQCVPNIYIKTVSVLFLRVCFPSDVIILVLSSKNPVAVHFNAISSTEITRILATVDYQGSFSLLNSELYSDRTH